MKNRLAIASLAVVISISPLAAQIRGAGVVAGSPMTGGFVGHGGAGGPGHFHHGRGIGSGSILLPYPYYNSDFGYDTPEPAPPQVVIVPAAAPAQPASPAVPLEPLLIEWQGDHFERMTLSSKAAGSGQGAPDYSAKSGQSLPGSSGVSSQGRKVVARPPRRELPPAVLVFRDGRKEEVSSYTIMSGTIYSNADYWTSGSWTKKIQIADLDVPATLKLNQERGLNFVLPGGPNEVVTRP
jgi:hypothetical protein